MTIALPMIVGLQMGFGFVIGFTEHLKLTTASNYSATSNSHTMQFTTSCTKSSQSAVSPPDDAW
jgi:hypothetical protein